MFLDFQQKRRINKIIYSKFFLIVLAGIFIYSSYSTYLVYKKKKDSEKEVVKIESYYLEMQSKKNNIEKDIIQLKTDDGIEKEIRDKFGLAKDSEQMIVIVNDKNIIPPSTKEPTFWQKVKYFFHFK